MMSKANWLVVVDASGRVLALAGGAPDTWRDASASIDPRVGEAIASVAAEVRGGAPRSRRTLTLADAEVEVVAWPAILLARRPAALSAIVERALAPFRAQAEARDVLLRIELEDGAEAMVLLDAAKIIWSIATLVGNALRFVRSGSRHAPGGTITVRLASAGDCASVSVEDDGDGIEAGDLAKLFDPERGAAVALAMTRDVATAHGGALSVTSDTSPESHGTKVVLELPIAPV
jgi:signal transduction histidine kinase